MLAALLSFELELSVVMENNLLDEPAAGQLVAVSDIHFERDLDVLVHLYSYALTLKYN